MDQTILFPSPNWFLSAAFAASNDGWLVYGGPSKSLCVMEPLPADSPNLICGKEGYQSHITLRAHSDRISCIDLNPEWPEKKTVLTGSVDGTVKQWSLEKTQQSLVIKSTHNHEIHSHGKEEAVGVGFCKDGYAVSVGSLGSIVKWDLTSNVVKSFNKVLSNFKPQCLACSPHIHLHVAIGTKQGMVFVLDLNGSARVLYKIRAHDEDVLKVGWCPQYEVAVRKLLKELDKKNTEKKSLATQRMEKIRQEPESPETMKALDEKVKKVYGDQPGSPVPSTSTESEQVSPEKQPTEKTPEEPPKSPMNESGVVKTLPEDSFDDQQVVQEDDMFDIYKEPDIEEFGHKKYQPIDIMVKVKEESTQEDYLAECLKLKEEIIKRKNQPEPSIETLVDALDKTHVDESAPMKEEASPPKEASGDNQNAAKVVIEGKIIKGEVESSVHIHKHLLATVSRLGNVKIWSKSGKSVGSCAIPTTTMQHNKKTQKFHSYWFNLLWYKPESLLLVDGKSQLLECNPLKIDCKNRLEYRVFPTIHRRGLVALGTSAPRVQPPEMAAERAHDQRWLVWAAAQDRSLVAYSVQREAPVHVLHTCGGFLYKIAPCAYDATKLAVAVGDGEVRVWETDTMDDDDNKLTQGKVTSFSHNVQGKVLTVAWHPTKENVLAFATGEARVGIIDTSGKRAARTFPPALSGGVYALSWADDWRLFAAGGGQLALFQGNNTDEGPNILKVELEGRKLEISSVEWFPRGLLVGSNDGIVLALDNTSLEVQAAAFAFSKTIHSMVWHPQETSSSSGESPHKDLIAVCSVDRVNTVQILQYGDKEGGGKQLSVVKSLSGHKGAVLELGWNPHQDGLLFSTSADTTVRVWDVPSGTCIAIFGGHAQSALGAAWSPRPQHSHVIVSGGADCAARVWDLRNHPPESYTEKTEPKKERRKKEKKKEEAVVKEAEEEEEGQGATLMEAKLRSSKKFLLPMTSKQVAACRANGPRRMLNRYIEKESGMPPSETLEHDLDFIKLFGTINEVNEVLDMEMEWHQDTGNMEAWMMLSIFRGFIDAMIQHASQHNLLDPYLVSIAPCVSFKFWKDTTLLYLAQIDRLIAKGEDAKLNESRRYGGSIYRKTATLLSLHDVKGALQVLCDAKLYMEAFVLCRVRYMESLVPDMLVLWAEHLVLQGRHNMAAVCYVALGDISQAANVLGKSKEEDSLSLAAEMAKLVGQTTFADHVEAKKREMMKLKELEENNDSDKPEEFETLPTRAELLLKDAPEVVSEDDSFKDSEKDSKSDTVQISDAESAVLAVNNANVENSEPIRNSVEEKDQSSRNNNEINNVDETIKANNSQDLVTGNDLQVNQSPEVNITNGNKDHNECTDIKIDKIEQLLEELPSKLEGLMKDNINGIEHLNASDGEKVCCTKEKPSDINDNMDGKGDCVPVLSTNN